MMWTDTTVGTLVELEYGEPLKSDDREESGKVPVAGSNGVVGYHSRPLVKGPGIVVGRKGSAGKVTWFADDFWPIDTTFYVRPKIPLNLKWAFYLLNHLNLEKLAIVTGVPGLNRNHAYQLPAFLPARREQNRIVELLEQADALRQKRAEADALANRILPALFHKLFGDPAKNEKGLKPETLKQAGGSVRYGLGQPPKSSDDGLPLLRATNLHRGQIFTDNLIRVRREDVPPGRNAFLKAEEIIVVRSGAYTGDVAQVTESWEGAVAGYDLVVTPGARLVGEFLESYLLTPFIQRNYFGNIKARAGQPHLNSDQVESTPLLVPPKLLQERFAGHVKALRKDRVKRLDAAKELNSLFATMLHRAFTGELTAQWREAHLKELLAEMEQQAKALNLPANGKN